jgi:secondary thiamine-phosphate synthase enzyme
VIYTVAVETSKHDDLIEITDIVREKIAESGVKEGLCIVFVPHTTACVLINENADPSVKIDLLNELSKIIPDSDNYLHLEGNSNAHIKTAIIGSSRTILVKDNKLMLGTWQGIFFAEFDGPRHRKFYIEVIST